MIPPEPAAHLFPDALPTYTVATEDKKSKLGPRANPPATFVHSGRLNTWN